MVTSHLMELKMNELDLSMRNVVHYKKVMFTLVFYFVAQGSKHLYPF